MKTNPYVMTEWHDHIVDPITGEVIEEGTRFTANRANNIEEGVYNAYAQIIAHYEDLQRMRVQIDMIGRAPVNNGTFFDTVAGETKALAKDTDSAIAQNAVVAGATSVTLNATPFAVGEYIAIYDDAAHEVVRVTSVGSGTVGITATTNEFKKGAYVTRTSAVVTAAGDKILPGGWGTYTITVTEVV